MGMTSWSSASKTLQKFSLAPTATSAYEFVSVEKTPTSFEFSNCARTAIFAFAVVSLFFLSQLVFFSFSVLSVQALGIFPKYTRSDVDVWLWSCSGFFDWNEGIFSAYDAVDFSPC